MTRTMTGLMTIGRKYTDCGMQVYAGPNHVLSILHHGETATYSFSLPCTRYQLKVVYVRAGVADADYATSIAACYLGSALFAQMIDAPLELHVDIPHPSPKEDPSNLLHEVQQAVCSGPSKLSEVSLTWGKGAVAVTHCLRQST